MTPSGSGWRFQTRLPAPFVVRSVSDGNFPSARTHLRVSTGPMTVREAREFGARAVEECRRVFDAGRLRLAALRSASVDGEDGRHGSMEAMNTIDAALREGIDAHAATLTAAERAVVDEVIAAGTIALKRMAERPQRTDAILDTLSRTQQSLEGVLQVARLAPNGPDGVDAAARSIVRDFARSFGRDVSALDEIAGPIVPVASDRAPANVGSGSAGTNGADGTKRADYGSTPFSEIASAYCAKLDGETPPMDVKDRNRIRKVLAGFVEWSGDPSFAACDRHLLKRYAKALEHLPYRAIDIRALKGATLTAMIEHGRRHKALRKISRATIEDGYLAFAKAAMAHFADTHDLDDPFAGVRTAPSRKKRPKQSYRPLPIPIVNAAVRNGAASGKLVAAVMPALGLLTTRRVAVLTFLHVDWLERSGEHWICRPNPLVKIEGKDVDLRHKNGFSLLPFAIHDELVRCGIVAHMQKHGYLFEPALRGRSPEAAISKRMGNLLKKAGAKGRDKGEVFHSLRANGIALYRQHVPDLVRNQSGHAPKDDHEGYDFGALTDVEHVERAATVPLPSGLDLSALGGFDLDRGRIVEERMAKAAQQAARTKSERRSRPIGRTE